MLQQDGDGVDGDDGDGVVDDGDDDPDKSSVMTMTMAMISPLPEGISPAGSPCQRAFSLSLVSVP